MSFTIQHPVSGLSWAANDDGRIVLSSTSVSIYAIENGIHIHNINTSMCVNGAPGFGESFFEMGHEGAMPYFEWTMADDGSISGPPAYGACWVGEDLTVSGAPFAWKKVLSTRLASPEPEVEPEAEPVAEPEVEPEAEPVAEPEAEPVAEPEAEPEVEPEAEPVAEPVAEPEAEPEAFSSVV
jgi:hypothetical protein